MFCPKCGNKIPENTNFCNSCGAAVTTENPTSAVAQKKPTNKLIPIIAGIAAFLIASFVIAPAITKSYTDNSTPTDLTSSVTQNSASEPSVSQSNSTTASDNAAYGKTKTKVFEIKTEGVMTSQFSFIYSDGKTALHEDDSVTSILGFINVSDLTVSGLDTLKQDAENLNSLIESYKLENMEITVKETDYSYSINVSFTDLDGENRKTAAELAAKYIGISCNNGIIKMSSAESEMLGFNYSLKDEY